MISDGWSDSILWRELTTLYDDYASGRPSSLPELPLQFVDYAVWQRELFSTSPREAYLRYWQHQLRNPPAMLHLPLDRPRPDTPSFRYAERSLRLLPQFHHQLRDLSAGAGVTLAMTLFAAFCTLLHAYSQDEDMPVATMVANRDRFEVEGIMGPLAN